MFVLIYVKYLTCHRKGLVYLKCYEFSDPKYLAVPYFFKGIFMKY